MRRRTRSGLSYLLAHMTCVAGVLLLSQFALASTGLGGASTDGGTHIAPAPDSAHSPRSESVQYASAKKPVSQRAGEEDGHRPRSASAASANGQQRGVFVPIMLNDGDGVRNGGFEEWMEERPLFWTFPEGHNRWHVQTSEDVKEGRFALKMAGGTNASGGPLYSYTKLACNVDVSGPVAGKTLVLSAWVKNYDSKTAYITIKPEGDHEKGTYSKTHPGDGEWVQLEATYTFPQKNAPKSVMIELNHRKGPHNPCYYDDIRLQVR